MALRHSWKYRGLPCKSGQYRRSDGLSPEPGFATMDIKDLKRLSLETQAVPWRGAGGRPDMPGPLSIHTWNEFKNRGGAQRNDVAAAGEGFKLYSQLELSTESDEGNSDSIVYDDVYVDNAEEVEADLANAKDHDEGEVLVQFTDIRRLYTDHGVLLGRINCRLPNGKYDPTTVKNPKAKDDRGRNAGPKPTITTQEDEAWPFEDVASFLFSQLPGSPNVHFDGLKDLPPPEELDQIGTPIVNVLQDLLDNNGLVPKFQPDGSYLLARPGIKHLEAGQVAPKIGGKASPKWTNYETKSVTYRHVPPVIMVLGRRRLRRTTMMYVPVFRDVDGKIYRLADIGKVWAGYSIEKVNKQVPLQAHKSFEDVPPKLSGAGDRSTVAAQRGENTADLHFRRQEIMRQQAYRLYAPAQLFDEKNGQKGGGGAVYLTDRDQWPVPWLPVQNAPIQESELLELYPGHGQARSGKGGVLLVPPIVRCSRTGQVFYTDSEKATQHIRHRKDANTQWILDFKTAHSKVLRARSVDITAMEYQIQSRIERGEFIDGALAKKIWGLTGIDFKKQGTEAKVKEATELMKFELASIEVEKIRLEGVVKEQMDHVVELELEFIDILKKFETEGGIHLTGNLPHGAAPEGTFDIDSETGLLKFDEPVCVFYPPVCLDPEAAEVIADGFVSVTFGYEVNLNEPSDFSSILFARDENGKVENCGAARPSHVKPQVIHAPDLQILEDDFGDPMNLEDCIKQGRRKAEAILSRSPSYDGFVSKYSGIVNCVLERSIDSVQHVWDANTDLCYTYVAVNSPASALPAGAPKVPRLVDVENAPNVARKRALPIGGSP